MAPWSGRLEPTRSNTQHGGTSQGALVLMMHVDLIEKLLLYNTLERAPEANPQ